MRLNFNLKILSVITGFSLMFSATLFGQTYSFRNYGAESNIPNSFIYTINQSNNGFLWIGTGSGISRFDGFNYYTAQFPDSSSDRHPTACLKDKNGKLWFGCNDGMVYYAEDNRLRNVHLPNLKSINDITEGPDGLIYIIPQRKAVFSINPLKPEEVHEYFCSHDPEMFTASFTSTGSLLIGVQDNFEQKIIECRLVNDSASVTNVIEGFENSNVTAIHQTRDSTKFIVGTNGSGLFLLSLNKAINILTRFQDHPEWDSLGIQSISEDSEKYFWASTFGSGVIQLRLSDSNETVKSVRYFNKSSGLFSNDVKTVFQDLEGNFWIGYYGGGITILTSYAFSYYTPGKNSAENNILYVNSFKDKYILGTPVGFHLFDPVLGKSVSFTNLAGQIEKTEIISYHLDQEENLWIGTKGKGLFVRNSKGSVKLFYRSGDSGVDYINDIEMDGQNIWLATNYGVVVLDRKNGKEIKKFDISNNGLPSKGINKILLSRDGLAYLAEESDSLYRIDRNFKIPPSIAINYGSP